MNKLVLGDNLEVLRALPSESVDLVYLDPPFFSNRRYECIWGDKGEVRSFEDRWAGGIEHYIAWLRERVQEMHRVLKSTGSIYLHCDHHADAYIRVYILDPIFGSKNFRNEIVWDYGKVSNTAANKFLRSHDTILWYGKSDQVSFNPLFEEISERKKQLIETGYNTKRMNGKRYLYYYGDRAKGQIDESNFDYVSDVDITVGVRQRDIFRIDLLNSQSVENIKYPTQKPEALLERIIKASSNEGDLVLDPFVGGGTTVAVANRLGRQWIGIDQSAQAIRVSENRINNQGLTSEFEVVLHKYDYDERTDYE